MWRQIRVVKIKEPQWENDSGSFFAVFSTSDNSIEDHVLGCAIARMETESHYAQM